MNETHRTGSILPNAAGRIENLIQECVGGFTRTDANLIETAAEGTSYEFSAIDITAVCWASNQLGGNNTSVATVSRFQLRSASTPQWCSQRVVRPLPGQFRTVNASGT